MRECHCPTLIDPLVHDAIARRPPGGQGDDESSWVAERRILLVLSLKLIREDGHRVGEVDAAAEERLDVIPERHQQAEVAYDGCTRSRSRLNTYSTSPKSSALAWTEMTRPVRRKATSLTK
jgi:hypothetical protein